MKKIIVFLSLILFINGCVFTKISLRSNYDKNNNGEKYTDTFFGYLGILGTGIGFAHIHSFIPQVLFTGLGLLSLGNVYKGFICDFEYDKKDENNVRFSNISDDSN